jgi:4-amino-4-deoxy-L-arabinose transferase-like glycosyltransferase
VVRRARAPLQDTTTAEFRLPLLLIAPVILLNLIWAVVPEIQFDANNYHLAVSQAYLLNGGFIDLPYFFHSYFYRLVDMLFTMGLSLQGPAVPKLLSFGFSLVMASGVFSLGRVAFDDRTAAWATAFVYTVPVVIWLSGTAYIDNAVAMFVTATSSPSFSGIAAQNALGGFLPHRCWPVQPSQPK